MLIEDRFYRVVVVVKSLVLMLFSPLEYLSFLVESSKTEKIGMWEAYLFLLCVEEESYRNFKHWAT